MHQYTVMETFLLLPAFPYLCPGVFSAEVVQEQQEPTVFTVVLRGTTFNWSASGLLCFCLLASFHIQSSDRLHLDQRVEPLLSGRSGPLGSCGVPGAASGSGVLGEPQRVSPGTPHANIMQIQTRARTTALNSATLKHECVRMCRRQGLMRTMIDWRTRGMV